MAFVTAAKERESILEDAAVVGALAELGEVRIFRVNAEILDPSVAHELLPIEEFAVSLGVGREGDTVTYTFDFALKVKSQDGVDALSFEVRIGVLFTLSSADAELSESQLTAFGKTTGQWVAHPYLRATVSDMAARLGCPPVTLGLLLN